MDPRATGMSLH